MSQNVVEHTLLPFIAYC